MLINFLREPGECFQFMPGEMMTELTVHLFLNCCQTITFIGFHSNQIFIEFNCLLQNDIHPNLLLVLISFSNSIIFIPLFDNSPPPHLHLI